MEPDITLIDSDFEFDAETKNHGFFAFNILKSRAKDIFKTDRALFCLTKSDMFLKDLLTSIFVVRNSLIPLVFLGRTSACVY